MNYDDYGRWGDRIDDGSHRGENSVRKGDDRPDKNWHRMQWTCWRNTACLKCGSGDPRRHHICIRSLVNESMKLMMVGVIYMDFLMEVGWNQ